MSMEITAVVGLTFAIHLIATLSYSVRIVGARTGRIAVSFALFNVLVLASRMANTVQAPILAKHVETELATGVVEASAAPFRLILIAATAATIVGAFLIPSFQRLFSKAVIGFQRSRSVPRLLLHGFSKAGLRHLRDSLALPNRANLSEIASPGRLTFSVLLMNVVAVALLSTGVLSSLYAGYLDPSLRATSLTLSGIVNGASTLMLFVFVDPALSVLTDDVTAGDLSESIFRRCVVQMVGARVVGTLLAQFFLVPAALMVVAVARLL